MRWRRRKAHKADEAGGVEKIDANGAGGGVVSEGGERGWKVVWDWIRFSA